MKIRTLFGLSLFFILSGMSLADMCPPSYKGGAFSVAYANANEVIIGCMYSSGFLRCRWDGIGKLSGNWQPYLDEYSKKCVGDVTTCLFNNDSQTTCH